MSKEICRAEQEDINIHALTSALFAVNLDEHVEQAVSISSPPQNKSPGEYSYVKFYPTKLF